MFTHCGRSGHCGLSIQGLTYLIFIRKSTFNFSTHPHKLNNGDTSNEERQVSAIEQINPSALRPLSINKCPEGN